MKAYLTDCIDYENGVISPKEGLSQDEYVDNAVLVELVDGWGRANAVVRVDESYFLAVIK